MGDNHGPRVVFGQKALLSHVDDHLGWMALDDGDYSVRERSPYKDSFPTEDLTTRTRFGKLSQQWAAILATAHCRADEDFDEDFVSTSFDKQLDEATEGHHAEYRALVREVAYEYVYQVYDDYFAFLAWLPTIGIDCGQR